MLAAKGAAPYLVPSPDVDVRSELGERVNVWVEAAPPDHVAAGRRDVDCSETREQGAGEQERRAHAAAELLVEVLLRHVRCVDVEIVGPGPFGLGADVVEQLDHRLDVCDPRDVAELDRLAGEHAGGENRQGAVLVAGRDDRA